MINNIIKIDLHIHSSCSEYKDGPIVRNSNTANIEVLIKKLEDNEINLFSITDHNRFDFDLYKRLKTRISESQCVQHILPGVEFDVKLEEGLDSCHIIAIFDDREEEKVAKIWESIDSYKVLGKEDAYSISDFENILRAIGLKVCLIVHQRQGFEGARGRTHSLSNSTSDPSYFMKIGYIDSLEYNFPRAEGIVKKSLRDIDVDFPLITGSDCHQWEAYPHRELGTKVDRDFTFFKALPTFKGLSLSLTSFSSRANRSVNENESYIKSITVDDKDIPLANGINAIIGDNGSGKSLLANLLSGSATENYYKKIISSNKLSVVKSDSVIQDQIKFIRQGEIVEKVRDGKLFDNSNTDYYEDINTVSDFENKIKTYFDNVINYVKFNIEKNAFYTKLLQSNVEIRSTLGNNFNPVIDSSIEVNDNSSFKKRVDEIEKIKDSIENEINSHLEFYQQEKVESKLNIALVELSEVHELFKKKYYALEKLKKVKQLISKNLEDYNTELTEKRTSEETLRTSTIGKYTEFKNTLFDYILKLNTNNKFPDFPTPIPGSSSKSVGSYNFEKVAKYHQVDIKESFYTSLFNQGFQSEELIKQIDTKDTMSRALKGSDYDKLNEFKESKLEKFIQSWCEETTTISEIKVNDEIGNTPGEISLVYYKFITRNDTDNFSVLIIDQPEDDINPKRINEFLIAYLAKIRDKKQVILATHNPMLVVNLDVDNVIYVNKNNDQLKVKYGCLEYDSEYDPQPNGNDHSILDLVKDNLDGGYRVIERRLKSYERD